MKNVENIIKALAGLYPNPECALTYKKPHELIIAARLSAQCTDKRVNLVTPELFRQFPGIKDYACAEANEIEKLVHSCGLYKTKAGDIIGMCRMLNEDYNSVIPDNLDELLKLPGIGRKTANLIIGTLYNKPAIVTDTHVIRLSNRLGLAGSKNPVKVENSLRKIIPEKETMNFCHRLVFYGRDICKAQKPICENCVIKKYCVFIKDSV
jgi:endonuclease-3